MACNCGLVVMMIYLPQVFARICRWDRLISTTIEVENILIIYHEASPISVTGLRQKEKMKPNFHYSKSGLLSVAQHTSYSK